MATDSLLMYSDSFITVLLKRSRSTNIAIYAAIDFQFIRLMARFVHCELKLSLWVEKNTIPSPHSLHYILHILGGTGKVRFPQHWGDTKMFPSFL